MARRKPEPDYPRDPVVPVRVPPAQRDALRRLAAADGKTQSELAREAFSFYLSHRQDDLDVAS